MIASLIAAIGVIMIILSAFGIAFPAVDIFKLGVAICFAGGGVYYYYPARPLP
jgi:hypothetical protein